MKCWCGYLSGARCRLFAYGPADATASQNPIISCLAFKSRHVLPFWYRLTQDVLEKRPLNGVVVVVTSIKDNIKNTLWHKELNNNKLASSYLFVVGPVKLESAY